MTAKAFSPGHITCIYRIENWENPEKMSTTGLGMATDKGVSCQIKDGDETRITLNGEKVDFPTVKTLISSLTDAPVSIKLESQIPFGYGFGASGASALSCALALNKLFALGKSDIELAEAATAAERKNKTGLSDVCGSFYGGLSFITTLDSLKLLKRYPPYTPKIYAVAFDEIDTRKTLVDVDYMKRNNTVANEILDKIILQQDNSLHNLLNISREFADRLGLLTHKDVVTAIKSVEKNNGAASMIMMGHAVISDTKEGLEGYDVIELKIEEKGAHVI